MMTTTTLQTPQQSTDDRIFQGAFETRMRHMMGAMTLGLISGLAVAGGISLVALAMGGTVAAGTLLTAAVACGCSGMLIGSVMGADVGTSSGSSAASVKEIKKEMQAMEARLQASITGQPYNAPEEPVAAKPSMINVKTMLFFTPLAMGVGALLAMGPGVGLAASLATAFGLKTASAGVILSTSLLGMMGATFGINFPVLVSKLSGFYGKALSGELFDGRKPEVEDAPAFSQTIARAPEPLQHAHSQEAALSQCCERIAEQNHFQSRLAASRELTGQQLSLS